MKSIEFLENMPTEKETHVALIVFEPSSHRIAPKDVLLRGFEVKEAFDRVFEQVSLQRNMGEIILYNQLNRIGMMLDLVKNFDNVVLTKFVNKVWRRYAFFSHLGELFVDLDQFLAYKLNNDDNTEDLILQRLASDDSEDETTDDDEVDDTNSEDSNEKNDNAEGSNGPENKK